MKYKCLYFAVFLAVFSAMSLHGISQVKNPQDFRVLLFGNRQHIMFIDYLAAADTSEALKQAAKAYKLEIVDPLNAGKYEPYSIFARTYPAFIALDSNGSALFTREGFLSEENLMDFYRKLDTAITYKGLSVEKIERHYKRNIRRTKDYISTQIKGNRIDAQAAYAMSYISGSNNYNKWGSGASVTMAYRKSHCLWNHVGLGAGAGLDYFKHKPKAGGKNLREVNLRIPLEAEIPICMVPLFLCGQELSLRAGMWGSYRIGGSKELSRFDIGPSAALVLASGSFDISVGYQRGFLNCFSNSYHYGSGRRNILTVGFRLRYGD